VVKGSASGGTVCRDVDDGQNHTNNGTFSDGVAYTETAAAACSGSYKGSKITYTENVTKDEVAISGANATTCNFQVPYVGEQLTGTFSSATAVGGTQSADSLFLKCANGASQNYDGEKGTWTGTATLNG
jgi:hypothetical protein